MENRITKIRPVLRRSLVESAQAWDENSDWTGWIRKTLLRDTNDGCWVPCDRIELKMIAFFEMVKNFPVPETWSLFRKISSEKNGQFRNLKPCEIAWEKNLFLTIPHPIMHSLRFPNRHIYFFQKLDLFRECKVLLLLSNHNNK